jgi:hypothetical protein
LIATPDSRLLLAVDSGQGKVFSIGVDADSGKLGNATVLAEVAAPTSLTLKYI